MQNKSTLFKAGVIATMALATASLSAQKVTRSELMKQVVSSKASVAVMKADAARPAAPAALLKYNKPLKNAQAAPFASALRTIPYVTRPAQPVGHHNAPMANPNANLVGYVSYSGTESISTGMNSIQMPSADFELLGSSYSSTPSNGCYVEDDKYYAVDVFSFFGYYFFYPVIYNMADWSDESPENQLNAEGYEWYLISLTNNPLTGKGLGCGYSVDASAFELSSVDIAAGTRTAIGTVDQPLLAMATAGDGTVYGLGEDSNLYKVDPSTAALTLVGPTGYAIADEEGAYTQSFAIDAKGGACYWFALNAAGNESPIMSVDLATGAATKVADKGLFQVLGAYALAPAAEDDAPAGVTDLAVTFETTSLEGVATFTAPTTTFATTTLTGELTYALTYDEETKTGTCQPGEAVSVPVTVTEGNHIFVLTTANAAGASPKAKVIVYAGQDTPVAPANVAFSYDAAAQQATVTWSPVTASMNNGYLGDVTYNVYDPEGNVVAAAIAETTCTVAYAPTSLGSYVFAVEALAGDKVSAKSLSNGVVIGSAMEVPCQLDFTKADAITMCTVIDANEDGKTWTFGTTSTRCPYNSSMAADDWLILPDLNLKAGKAYVLTYNAWSQSSYFPEKMEVTVGQGATAAAQTTVLVAPYTVPVSGGDPVAVDFTVAADGVYNIAFHSVSDADMYYLNLGLVTIEAGPEADAPAAAALEVVAPEGSLDYTLNITVPTKTVAGGDLASVSKIVIAAPAGEVTLEEGYTPGQVVAYNGSVEASGTYSWTVVCYNEAGNGIKAKTEAFLGQDAPGNVTDAVLTDNGTSVTVSWSAVTTGLNGGYINPADVKYEIYSITDDGYVGTLLVETAETSATIDQNTSEGEQTLLQYAIRATGPGGNSSYSGTSALVIGEPDKMPWIEPFANGGIEKFLWTSTQSTMKVALTSVQGDGGAAIFTASDAPSYGSLITGKISASGAINPQVIVDYMGEEGITVDVVLRAPGKEDLVIGTVQGTAEWQTASFAVPADYTTAAYFLVAFTANATEASKTAYIDNIQVRDVLEYNLSLELNAPETLVKGETTYVTATVTNEGAQAVENATVKFTVNGEVSTSTYSKTLQSFQTVEFPVEIVTSILDEEEAIEIEAEVVYDLDLKPEDNVASAVIELKDPTAAGVEGLTAEPTEEGVLLSWTAPTAAYGVVTDDLESYEMGGYPDQDPATADPNMVGHMGDWTMYDLDGGSTYTWNGVTTWNWGGRAYAYAILNWVSVFGEDYAAKAHSGEQVLLSMSIDDGTTTNNDWLISPALPGVAQTISFWYSELSSQYGDESFEVYYSTTDMEVASFIKIGDTNTATTDWQQMNVELPEGTKYFAIRCISKDIFGFLLDDFQFTAGVDAPTSFNIYADGEFVANTTETSYLVTTPAQAPARAEANGHVYAVTAVYADGTESAPAKIVVDDIVGIEQIAAEAKKAPVYNTVGVRVSEPKAGIFITNGKKVAQ